MGSLLVAIISLGLIVSCASVKTVAGPAALTPVKVTDVTVERLNPGATDKFQKTDVLF